MLARAAEIVGITFCAMYFISHPNRFAYTMIYSQKQSQSQIHSQSHVYIFTKFRHFVDTADVFVYLKSYSAAGINAVIPYMLAVSMAKR